MDFLLLILLFLGPPTIAAILLVGMLHAPFHAFEDESRGLKIYFWFRVVLLLFGFVGLLIFRLGDGYDDLSFSEFSPIGTDGRGLIVVWIIVAVIAFGIFSFIELLKVLGDRMLHDPDRKPREQNATGQPATRSESK